MGTAYGITGATCWVNMGTPSDTMAIGTFGTAGYNTVDTNENLLTSPEGLLGTSISSIVETFGGTLTQATSADRPVLVNYGSHGHGDGSNAAIKFPNYYLNSGYVRNPRNLSEQMGSGSPVLATSSIYLDLPSSCAIFNGTHTGEATIFIAGRFGDMAGGPFQIGAANSVAIGLYGDQADITANGYQFGAGGNAIGQPSVGMLDSGGANLTPAAQFLNPVFWPNMQPVVMALRMSVALGAVGHLGTDFWLGATYRESNTTGTVKNDFSTATLATGGFLGACTNSQGTLEPLDCEISEFLVYQNALTDSQVTQIIQTMQDKHCGGFSNDTFVLFFGDSRTAGQNPRLGGSGGTSSSTFDAGARCWPKRCLSQMGGYALGLNQARTSDSITQQLAVLNTAFDAATGNPQYGLVLENLAKKTTPHGTNSFTQIAFCGEIGINDIYFNGQTAAQVEANLTTLWQAAINDGATAIVPGTIVLPAIGTVFDSITWTSTLNNIGLAVNTWIKSTGASTLTGAFTYVVADNAADTRLAAGGVSGYFDTDGLHFTDAGYGVYAQNFATALAQATGRIPLPATVANGSKYWNGVLSGTLVSSGGVPIYGGFPP